MSNVKKLKGKPVFDENPEWTPEDFARARPAIEVLPKILNREAAERLLKSRGRPILKTRKGR